MVGFYLFYCQFLNLGLGIKCKVESLDAQKYPTRTNAQEAS